MLKIWGRIWAMNVRKVVFTAQLLELPFERIDAGAAFGVTKMQQHLDPNPDALLPTLEDNDVVQRESDATLRHLCAKHPQRGLNPQALPASASKTGIQFSEEPVAAVGDYGELAVPARNCRSPAT